MQILSHRGYWKIPAEKNTPKAFERSFALGFGTELDVRDYQGQLVIAHDPPLAPGLTFAELLAILVRHDRTLPLAVNIKADGLQALLREALTCHGIANYFLFDMSVPDAVQSHKAGLRIFTRHSEVEPAPALYQQSTGVWMDSFFDDTWLTPNVIASHLATGKEVCLVSPELHQRPHLAFWQQLRESQCAQASGLLLCTDLPETAAHFFKS